MDLFGFKRRKREKQEKAAQRARAMADAVKTVRERPDFPPLAPRRNPVVRAEEPPRRHRPETDPPDYIQAGGLYPHGSAYGMPVVDSGPSSRSSDDSSRSSDTFGPAGSGLNLDSGSSYSSPSSYDTGGSSSSSSYDTGSSSSSSSFDSGSSY